MSLEIFGYININWMSDGFVGDSYQQKPIGKHRTPFLSVVAIGAHRMVLSVSGITGESLTLGKRQEGSISRLIHYLEGSFN